MPQRRDQCHREQTHRKLGPVDILIAFAGGFAKYTPIQDLSEQKWRAVIDSNLTSTFLTVRSFLPAMIQQSQAAIVTMSSIAGRLLDLNLTASYAAAKAAIAMVTRHVAREVGQFGVRANCVAPGTTPSERIEQIMPGERQQAVAEMAPLRRLGLPRERWGSRRRRPCWGSAC